ncbi:phage protease [Erythrobacter sp. NE805]|uniref:phage protease n=1 Tax=Erythrobacter sp. NE805 TaxID=3389875 RepID=UPI00396AF24C
MSKPAASSADVAVIASAIAVPVQDGAPAKRFRIVPFGYFSGRDGRGPWLLRDKAHAERVIAATKAFLNGVDLLVNYDHQSEFSAVPGVGGMAKAAGWVSPDTLEVGDDGIYVTAEWTEAAEAALQAREYRYYSPHFRADKATGELTRIVNVGLTNSPNIEVSALASQEAGAFNEGSPMKKIAMLLSASALTALGLKADSEDEAAINAIDKLIEDRGKDAAILASVRTHIKLKDDADEEAVLNALKAAAEAGEPDPSKYVPIHALKDVQKQLGALQEDKVLAAVDAAIEEGKLTPAQRDWALKLGKQDISELNSFLATAPAFKGGKVIEGTPETRKTALTEEEAAICSMMGVSAEDYLKARNAEEKEG